MAYGVTPTGFNRPSVEQLLADIEADEKSLVSEGLDVSAESVLGQVNGIVSRQLGVCWEAAEMCYGGLDPDRAEDFLLTMLSKITGTYRNPATPSVVTCSCTLTSGTTLQSGVHFARVVGNPNIRFTPRETFTAPATGTHNVVFQCEQDGPIQVAPGELSVIATAVVGWSAVTNPNPATPGTLEEADPSLRIRRRQSLAASGNQTGAAIKAALARLTNAGSAWVRGAEYYENTSNVTVNSRPPHSFEVIVNEIYELAPVDHFDQIAQTIWNNKPAGIEPWGDDDGTAVNDKGDNVTVAFSLVSQVRIWIRLQMTTVPGFTGAAAVAAAIVSGARAAYATPGQTVVALYVRSLAFHVPGVIDVPQFFIGTSPAPVSTSNIPMTVRQAPAFDVSDVTFL